MVTGANNGWGTTRLDIPGMIFPPVLHRKDPEFGSDCGRCISFTPGFSQVLRLTFQRNQSGSVDLIDALLSRGADINGKSAHGETALMTAVFWGNGNVVRALLNAGADTSEKNDEGKTALMLAGDMGHIKIAEMLGLQAKS